MPRTYIRRAGDRRPQTQGRRIRFYVPRWVDPFFWIQGSVPEKMVMAELVRRGIYFEHTPQKNQLGGMVDPTWEADFLFPQYKIWLEVNGLYFHTLPGAPERDALRRVMIEDAGWKFMAFWDFDILTRLQDIMNEVPEFYRVESEIQRGRKNHGLPFYEGGDGIDHLKGLRAQLRGRAKPPQYGLRRYQNWDRSPK
jgi:hypothetical protein